VSGGSFGTGGGTGGASSIAAGDITDAGAVGEALVQASTPAEARDAIDAAPLATTAFAFASSTGVTLDNGSVGGSAAVTGGVLRLTVPATPAAGYYGGTLEAPHADVAVPRDAAGRQPIRWRARVRVVAVPSGTIAYLLAVSGSQRPGILVGGDGSGGAEDNSGPSGYGSGWAAGTVPTDGTGWLEVEVCGSLATYRYGTGTTSTPPTTWTTHATATLPSGALYAVVRLVGASNSPPGSPTSVDFDDLTFEAL
jgi:hypothetical protein